MKRLFLSLFAVIAAVTLLMNTAYASPVYTWEDSSGVVHYSSKPTTKQAKQADLPKITRAEVKLTKQKMVTCSQHGGINCQAGPDGDGSVICYDGFKESSARYRFSCNAPKLEISDVSEVTPQGSFTVFVRNSRGVTASKPAVLYKSDDGRQVKLSGPEEVDSFGVAEFVYESAKGQASPAKPNLAQLDVTCANCPQ